MQKGHRYAMTFCIKKLSYMTVKESTHEHAQYDKCTSTTCTKDIYSR